MNKISKRIISEYAKFLYFCNKLFTLGGIPIPKPSFLDECILIGSVGGKKRWKSVDGKRLYEWDSLHGEIEVYNKRGEHLAVLNPKGDVIKSAKKGRTIDV